MANTPSDPFKSRIAKKYHETAQRWLKKFDITPPDKLDDRLDLWRAAICGLTRDLEYEVGISVVCNSHREPGNIYKITGEMQRYQLNTDHQDDADMLTICLNRISRARFTDNIGLYKKSGKFVVCCGIPAEFYKWPYLFANTDIKAVYADGSRYIATGAWLDAGLPPWEGPKLLVRSAVVGDKSCYQFALRSVNMVLAKKVLNEPKALN